MPLRKTYHLCIACKIVKTRGLRCKACSDILKRGVPRATGGGSRPCKRDCPCKKHAEENRKERSMLSTKHGRYKTVEYRAWNGMLQRCTNPNNTAYNYYGGRGITVCERWLSFINFFADMGERPSWATGGLDRIDNNGNYEPGNCRWSIIEEQAKQ